MTTHEALKLQAAIDNCIGAIVEAADEAIIGVKTRGKLGLIQRSQLKNLLAVSNTALHPAVITSFIRYQMGRNGEPRTAWKETKLGDEVINIVNTTLEEKAKAAIAEAGSGDIVDVQVRMARLLLGFMDRRLVYESADEAPKKGGKR